MMLLLREPGLLVHNVASSSGFTAGVIKTTFWTNQLALTTFKESSAVYAMLPVLKLHSVPRSAQRGNLGYEGQRSILLRDFGRPQFLFLRACEINKSLQLFLGMLPVIFFSGGLYLRRFSRKRKPLHGLLHIKPSNQNLTSPRQTDSTLPPN